ncbi:MAG: hypothetical protein J6W23_03555 [Victivallales bacterium]|nr:hypothetical protein [Victivallales bacterium]
MGKKSNKKNKPSKAEKRRQKHRYNDLSFSEKHLDEMRDHFETLVSEFWYYLSDMIKQDDPEAMADKDRELTYFNGLVNLAEEAWNIAVMHDSFDDACDTAYDTYSKDEAELIILMIKYKMDQFPQDKVLICDTETQREEDGEMSFSFDFDYSVMDDELAELEAKDDDDFNLDDWLDQKAIDKALEGIPPEFQKAAYNHEVNRQLKELREKFDQLLQAEKDGESSPES